MTDPYDEFQASFKNIAPKRLFLSPTDEDDAEVVDLSDCVWSEDRVCDADVEYIRADLAAIDILDLAKALKSRMDSERIDTLGFDGFAATTKPEMFEAPGEKGTEQ